MEDKKTDNNIKKISVQDKEVYVVDNFLKPKVEESVSIFSQQLLVSRAGKTVKGEQHTKHYLKHIESEFLFDTVVHSNKTNKPIPIGLAALNINEYPKEAGEELRSYLPEALGLLSLIDVIPFPEINPLQTFSNRKETVSETSSLKIDTNDNNSTLPNFFILGEIKCFGVRNFISLDLINRRTGYLIKNVMKSLPKERMNLKAKMVQTVNALFFPFFTLHQMVTNAAVILQKDVFVKRVVYREFTYGDYLTFHCDGANEDGFSLVYYLCEEWDVNWRGETVFLGAQGTLQGVFPKKNRAILFDAQAEHSTTAPAKSFKGTRKILVFNLVIVP